MTIQHRRSVLGSIMLTMAALMLSSGAMRSQSATADDIEIKSATVNGDVLLRWGYEDYEMWQLARDHGVRLIRTTIEDTNGPLPDSVAVNTIDTLLFGSLPASTLQEWEDLVLDVDLAQVGFAMYNTDSFATEPPVTSTLDDAIRYQENIESNILFASLLADQSFGFARASMMAYRDTTAQPGYIYYYKLSITDTTSTYGVGIHRCSATSDSQQAPTRIEGRGRNLIAEVSWSAKGLTDDYVYYNIERSDDGGTTFFTVNSEPFIGFGDAAADPESMTYIDTLPANGIAYYYRVKGLSPFGFEGPPSDTVMVVGVPPRLDLQVVVDSIMISESIEVYFGSTPHDFDSELVQFELFYQATLEDTLVSVSNSVVPATDRVLVATLPLPTAYYTIVGTDVNQHRYSSIAFLGQAVDTIPPAAPQGLTGTIDQSGLVDIDWDDNTEEDLDGYKVFYSDVADGDYVQLTVDHVDSSYYFTQASMDVTTDSIFYKVAAIDNRYNMSEYSEPFLLLRPDLLPPTKPTLAQMSATAQGIRIAWRLSGSDDVSHYTLQRRKATSTTWLDVITFTDKEAPLPPLPDPAEDIPATYLDAEELPRAEHVYRLLAYDDSDNVSASAERSIYPYDDGIRGEISGFAATQVIINYQEAPITHANAQGYINLVILPFEPKEEQDYKAKAVSLTWQYETDSPSSLREFKVYRRFKAGQSNNGVTAILSNRWSAVKTISTSEAELLAAMVGHDGYMALDTPNPQKIDEFVDYEYKVLAIHSDGGFSMDSAVVDLRFY